MLRNITQGLGFGVNFSYGTTNGKLTHGLETQ